MAETTLAGWERSTFTAAGLTRDWYRRGEGPCVVVVHEAPRTLGVGAEIAAQVTESCFTDLLAPVLRVTGWDTPYPPSRVESLWLPDVDRVLDAIDTVLEG